MAHQDALAFLAKLSNDENLQKEVVAPGAQLVDVAKKAGFNCTSDELLAAGREVKSEFERTKAGELSDAQLQNVSGGAGVSKPTTPSLQYKNMTFNTASLAKINTGAIVSW